MISEECGVTHHTECGSVAQPECRVVYEKVCQTGGYSPGSYRNIGPYGHRLYKRGAQQEGGKRNLYESSLLLSFRR